MIQSAVNRPPKAHAGDQPAKPSASALDAATYQLDQQIGFILRRVFQRHAIIFQDQMVGGLTPTQFAALIRLEQAGTCSQNHLGRLTAMDIATIKGVVDRLRVRGLVTIEADINDRRRRSLTLTEAGQALVQQAKGPAKSITRLTLEPLKPREQQQLLDLLDRIA